MTETPVVAPGLDDDTQRLVNGLLELLRKKAPRNKVRKARYDAKYQVKMFANVLPPAYQQYALTLGWSARAVDALAARCRLRCFTHADGMDTLESMGGLDLIADNDLLSETGQAVTSSLIHATAWVTTVAGEVEDGEPPVLIQYHDALSATGEWNARRRRLDAALVVNDRDKRGNPTSLTLHEYGVVTSLRRDGGRWSVMDRVEHDYGMTADPMRYRARLGRPFGSSRITRPMMSIQDEAIRDLMRAEGHMDVYAWPEFWLLGADKSVFGSDDRFQIMLGRIKAIPDDNDAANPRADVKQFPSSSPEPHLAHINAMAKLFAREAGMPDSSLAITDTSNPTSAEAYDSSQYELIAEAETAMEGWQSDLERAYVRALAMLNRDPRLMKQGSKIHAAWRPARFLSRSAEADAGMKQLAAVPWLAETEVGLELLGLTPEQIARATSERRRNSASSTLDRLLSGGAGAPAEDADEVRAYDDAR